MKAISGTLDSREITVQELENNEYVIRFERNLPEKEMLSEKEFNDFKNASVKLIGNKQIVQLKLSKEAYQCLIAIYYKLETI